MFWWAFSRSVYHLGTWRAIKLAWRFATRKGRIERMTRQIERQFYRSLDKVV